MNLAQMKAIPSYDDGINIAVTGGVPFPVALPYGPQALFLNMGDAPVYFRVSDTGTDASAADTVVAPSALGVLVKSAAQLTGSLFARSPGAVRMLTGAPFVYDASGNITGLAAASKTLGIGGVKQHNVGMRYFYGRYADLTNDATGYTYQTVVELPVMCDAFQIILANTQTSGTANFQCGIAMMPDTSDIAYNGGTYPITNWSDGNTGALTVAQVPNTTDANYPKYLVSDVLGITPVARTDGVAGCIIGIRCFVRTTTVTATVLGNGSTDNWIDQGARPAGQRVWCKRKIGQHLSAPTTFTSPSDTIQSPVAGIIYYARGRVINVAKFGDSITDGRGTYAGDSYVNVASRALSSSNLTYEISNFGRSGATSPIFCNVANDAIAAFPLIDLAVVQSGSPNDVTGTIDAAEGLVISTAVQKTLRTIRANNRQAIEVTWIPSNPTTGTPAGTKDYGSSDSLRRAYNTGRLLASTTLPMIDASAVMSGTTDGSGQVNMVTAYTTDGIHPNDTGNAAIAIPAQATLAIFR